MTTAAARRPSTSTAQSKAGKGASNVVPIKGFHLTDLGNAERLVDQHGEDLRYVWDLGRWLTWDEHRWVQDRFEDVYRRARDTVRSIYREAADSSASKEVAAHAMRSEARPRVDAMVSMAGWQRPPWQSEDLDQDPWLLSCANGTLDLRTAELRAPRREDRITRHSPVAYDMTATAPTWRRFLARIQPDPEVQRYLQRAVGYSLTGLTSEQKMFLLSGRGQNGKSTLVDVLMWMLGDLSQKGPSDLLMHKPASDLSNDVARIRGTRLVTVAETEEGRRLAEGRVKDLTGGEQVSARFLHQEFFDFYPTCKMWLTTNHLPEVHGSDEGIWRRLVHIPFNEYITNAERDNSLPDKLRAELPGILAWAVQGCLEWQRDGLAPPAALIRANAEYRSEQDLFGGFLADRCVVRPDVRAYAAPLYESYKDWCEHNGHNPFSTTRFGRKLRERGFRKDKKGTIFWEGVSLAPDAWTDSEPAVDQQAASPVREQPAAADLLAPPCLICGQPCDPAVGLTHPSCDPDDRHGGGGGTPPPAVPQDPSSGGGIAALPGSDVDPDVDPAAAVHLVERSEVDEQPVDQADDPAAPLAGSSAEDPPGEVAPVVVTRRSKRPWTARSTVYLTWSSGKGTTDACTDVGVPRRASLSALLAALPEDVQQVFLVGAPPGGAGPKFEAWALGACPAGWSVPDSGHYLDRDARDRAALRFTRPDGGAVTVLRITSWLDDPTVTPEQARSAFAVLRAGLAEQFGEGAPLLATPATTGRELLLRSLPYGHTFPVLASELRELLHHTTGQGRFEMPASPEHHTAGRRFGDPTIPGLYSADMRFAYAGLCRGALGAGPGELDDRTEFLGHAPARYRVTFRVPDGWDHLGLLGVLGEDGAPWWPSTPNGQSFDTWVSGRELLLAERHGWTLGRDVYIRQRLTFGTSKAEPLRTWADKLTALREQWLPAQDAPPVVLELARDMVRAIVLQALGALQGRRSKRTHVLPDSRYDEVPRGVDAHEAGSSWVWQTEEASAWEQMAHPEWVAAVWAGQRCRVLDSGPTAGQPNVGALHVPADQLLAVRADAVYSTAALGWTDPGKVGQFRPQLAVPGPHPIPRSQTELLELAARLRGA